MILPLRSWKAGSFLVVSLLPTVRSIVTRGSRVSRAPSHHTLLAFLNLHGSRNYIGHNNYIRVLSLFKCVAQGNGAVTACKQGLGLVENSNKKLRFWIVWNNFFILFIFLICNFEISTRNKCVCSDAGKVFRLSDDYKPEEEEDSVNNPKFECLAPPPPSR